MLSKMLLTALAAVSAVVVIASPPQDPSFEFPAAKHIGYDLPKQEGTAAQGQSRQAKDHVSVTFRNATVREVLDWLKDQGVSFVVTDQQVDKDARVSINAVNQPVEELMQALARSWNGHWQRNNDIWVFQKGMTFTYTDGDAPATAFTLPPLQGQKLTDEQRQEMEKAMKQLQDSQVWEQHAKELENLAQELQKRGDGHHMDAKAMQELQEKMLKLRKDGKVYQYELKPGQNGFTWDGKDFKPLDEKQLKEMQERAMEMAKEAQKAWSDKDGRIRVFDEKSMKEFQEKMKKMGKDGQFFVVPGEPFKMDAKSMKEFQEKMEKMGKDGQIFMAPGRPLKIDGKSMGNGNFRFFTPGKSSSFSSHNLKAIYDSLTPAQEKTLESRGFLRYSDLNSNQRAMLGIIGDDSWTISYKTDKVNITIKSDR